MGKRKGSTKTKKNQQIHDLYTNILSFAQESKSMQWLDVSMTFTSPATNQQPHQGKRGGSLMGCRVIIFWNLSQSPSSSSPDSSSSSPSAASLFASRFESSLRWLCPILEEESGSGHYEIKIYT